MDQLTPIEHNKAVHSSQNKKTEKELFEQIGNNEGPLCKQHWIKGFETERWSIYKFSNIDNRIQRKKTVVNKKIHQAINGQEKEFKNPSDIAFFIDSRQIISQILEQYQAVDPISGKSMTASFDHLFFVKKNDHYILIDKNNCNNLLIKDSVHFMRIREGMKIWWEGSDRKTTKEQRIISHKQWQKLISNKDKLASMYFKAINKKEITNPWLFIAICDTWISLNPQKWDRPFDVNFANKTIHLGNKITKLYSHK